ASTTWRCGVTASARGRSFGKYCALPAGCQPTLSKSAIRRLTKEKIGLRCGFSERGADALSAGSAVAMRRYDALTCGRRPSDVTEARSRPTPRATEQNPPSVAAPADGAATVTTSSASGSANSFIGVLLFNR